MDGRFFMRKKFNYIENTLGAILPGIDGCPAKELNALPDFGHHFLCK